MATPALMALTAALSLLLATAVPAHASENRASPVAVSQVKETEVAQSVQLFGTVTSEHASQLSVSTSGLITVLKVDAGDEVQQGEVLLELDAELAQHQYDSALAAMKEAEHALEDARRRHEEAQRLAPKRSIAETVVKDLAAEVAEDTAALEQARADAGYRRGILERHRLNAPFPGVISNRAADLGEWVSPGEAVLSLVATRQLRLDFQMPEDYLEMVRDDSTVTFTLGSDRNTLYHGQVLTAVPVTDPATRTFLLRVKPLEEIPGMLPGMSVTAELKLVARHRGLTIPRDAILHHPDGRALVWVVEQGANGPVAREQLVQPGLVVGERVEIVSGLEAGQGVVVKGNESLRSGQALAIENGAGS